MAERNYIPDFHYGSGRFDVCSEAPIYIGRFKGQTVILTVDLRTPRIRLKFRRITENFMAQSTGNTRLQQARRNKKDEFYTQLSDIEKELYHYREHFKGKVVFCNCDDPYESNFFKYFAMNFNFLKLKKLIATCYSGSPVMGKELPLFDRLNGKQAFKIEITEVNDETGNGATGLADVEILLKNNKNVLTVLDGNGDFRSRECVELLKQADIVVTNPPFSLFREYVAQLIEYKKEFIIIGHQNAITYKEIFPLIKDNLLWLGYGFKGGAAFFIADYEDYASATSHQQGCIRVSGVVWFTNIETSKRHEKMILFKKYTPDEYPKYDNYDAINVDKTIEIPMDYDGVMGVPITFLDKYNPEQFEILGATESEGKGFSNGLWLEKSKTAQPLVNGIKKYKRLFIQRKEQ